MSHQPVVQHHIYHGSKPRQQRMRSSRDMHSYNNHRFVYENLHGPPSSPQMMAVPISQLYPPSTPLVSFPPPPPGIGPTAVAYPGGPFTSHMIVPMGHSIMPHPQNPNLTYETEMRQTNHLHAMMPVLLVPMNPTGVTTSPQHLAPQFIPTNPVVPIVPSSTSTPIPPVRCVCNRFKL